MEPPAPLEEAPETETLAEAAPVVGVPARKVPVERTASTSPRRRSEAVKSRVVAEVTDRGRLLVRKVDDGEGSAPSGAIVKPIETVQPDPATVAPSFRQSGDPEQSQTRANPPPRRSASNLTATHDQPSNSGNTLPLFSTETPEAYGVQAKLTVRRPGDRFEREADAVARAVGTGSSAPAISKLPMTRTGTAQRIGPGPTPSDRVRDSVSPSTTRAIRHPGPGRPLPDSVRSSIEPTLETSLADVQVHNGSRAADTAGRMGARAFTHDNHIFLGRGESATDVDLMAHEATHVVQQQGAPTVQRLLDLSLDDLPGIDAADIARRVPGFTLFTVILGYNPITNESVEFTGPNLIQGLFELVPFGADIYDALAERGIIEDAFAWIQENMPDISTERLTGLLEDAWDRMGITLSPAENIDILISTFSPVAQELETFGDRAVDKVIEFVKEVAIDTAEDLLNENRAWDLTKKILGRDPLRDEEVEAEPAEILEDFLLLIGKEEHLEQMRERGTVEETAQWLVAQLETFQHLLGRLRGLIESAWEALQPANLPSLATSIETLGEEVGTFLQDVWTFASTVAVEVLARIKNALLGWLSDYAHDIPGFHLLTVILGRNPFTEEPVPRTAENLIRGFITLLPGGAGIYQQLAESGVIEGAAGRIEAAMTELGITWEFVVGLFTDLWNSLSIEDLS